MKERKTRDWLVRRLSRFLLASGILNFLLLSLLFSIWLKTPSFDLPICRKSPPLQAGYTSSGRLILSLRQMPFEQLVHKLEETEPVECGYLQRDIALSCLVSKFHFDVQRALQSQKLPVRMVKIQGREHLGSFPLYPGLGDREYQSIVHFAKTERWPFSPEGLFMRLQQSGENLPKSLVNAFVMTDEFKEFQKKLSPIRALELVRMMLEVDWSAVAKAQNYPTPFQILQLFISEGSRAAAKTLLQTETQYALRQLDDETILQILDLLGENHPLAESFAKNFSILREATVFGSWQGSKLTSQSHLPSKFMRTSFTSFRKGIRFGKFLANTTSKLISSKNAISLKTDSLRPGKILKIPS